MLNYQVYIMFQTLMNVPLVLTAVSRYAVTQFQAGPVTVTLATLCVLMKEHVKVLLLITNPNIPT